MTPTSPVTPLPPAYRERVIPVPAWITAGAAFLCTFMLFAAVMRYAPHGARVFLPVLIALAIAGNILLIGYIYGDARRRGMRYVMWTLLAIFLFNGIGIILYFILREPMQSHCTRCGSLVQHSFTFCPRCGANVQPACPACHRAIQGPWVHCAWCGTKM